MEQEHEFFTFGRQVGYVIATNILTTVLVFIQIPIMSRALGAQLYGAWSLVIVTVSLLTPFAVLGLGTTIVRFLAAENDLNRIREDLFSVLSVICIVGIVLSLLLFVLSDFLATRVFKDASLSGYVKLASVLILLNASYQILISFFRAKRRMGLFSIITLASGAFQVSAIVILLSLNYKLTGAIAALIISGALFSLIALLITLKQIGFKIPRFSHVKAYLRWGAPLTPYDAVFWILTTSDRYIISYFLGVAGAGIYNAAYSIGSYASFALMPVNLVLFPNVVKTWDEGNKDLTRNYLSYSFKYLMMIAIPCAFGLSVLARPLLAILTTPEFLSGSVIVPFIASGAVLSCIFWISGSIINLAGKNHLYVILLAIAAGLNVILNIILIPRMGITGAALATLIAYAVLGVLAVKVSSRYFKFDIDLRSIVKTVFASAAMAFCIWLIHPNSLGMVAVSVVAGIIVYSAAMLIVKALSKGELAFFSTLVKNNLKKAHLIGGPS
jgi:O-antigen/teichoic acid export membrane protein